MAVEMLTEVQGMPGEQWEGFVANVLPLMKKAPGFISHTSGPIDNGHFVTELWESSQDHERWVREVIMPMMQQVGVTEPPVVQYRPVDHVIAR